MSLKTRSQAQVLEQFWGLFHTVLVLYTVPEPAPPQLILYRSLIDLMILCFEVDTVIVEVTEKDVEQKFGERSQSL